MLSFLRRLNVFWRVVIGGTIFAVLFAALCVTWFYFFSHSLVPATFRAEEYLSAETAPTRLVSRQWMNIALSVQRSAGHNTPGAARLYAYTAGVFADTLERTGSIPEASTATAFVLRTLEPDSAGLIDGFYAGMTKKPIEELSGEARSILGSYLARIEEDGYHIPPTETPPDSPTAWYPQLKTDPGARVGREDDSVMSGHWKPWLLVETPSVPPPPSHGGVEDRLDIQIAKYTTYKRTLHDMEEGILFWNGTSNSQPIQGKKQAKQWSTGYTGLWQNILFIEKSKDMSELEFAQAQKILAQTIADASIHAWKVKYEYYVQRPSMRIQDLDPAVADPRSPGYVSDEATVAAASAAILSSLFPKDTVLWEQLRNDAGISRVLAGVSFRSDVLEGLRFGQAIGIGLAKLLKLPEPQTHPLHRPFFLENILGLAALHGANTIAALELNLIMEKIRALGSSISFAESSVAANLLIPDSIYTSWGDYDNDGFIDLIVTDGIYRNKGDGTFQDVTAETGLSDYLHGITGFIDVDNDGCEDLIETRSLETLLLVNNCDGTFTRRGTFDTHQFSERPRGFAVADYDQDGDLDFYSTAVPTEKDTSASLYPSPKELNTLWRNDGNYTFTNVTEMAGVNGIPTCSLFPPSEYPIAELKVSFQPIWFDYDNDEDSDLFIATDVWVSPLYRNNGDGTFTDVTEAARLCKKGTGMGTAVADIDGNGYFDIYVTNIGYNYLWMNQGNGTFREEARERSATDREQGWGTQFVDFDNDADLDLYIANAVASYMATAIFTESFDAAGFKNLDSLYENDGTGHFFPVTEHAGIFGSYMKFSTATIDYDNDGKMDMYVASTGHPQGVYNSLYRNNSNTGNHWLKVRLVGTESNRAGIGARITVVTAGQSQQKELLRGSSFLSQESQLLHFGLAKASMVDTLTIRWPSGKEQTMNDIPVDQVLTLTEPE